MFFADEMRFGLMTNEKRSWSAIGERSRLPNQMEYSNRYLYSAISPQEGDSFHIIGFNRTDTESTNIFLDALQEYYPHTHNIVIWDNAPFHKPAILHSKENLTILTLPSYGQELNPVERFFGELRKATANRTYRDIAELETLLDNEVATWMADKERMKRLTYWDWIEEQIG